MAAATVSWRVEAVVRACPRTELRQAFGGISQTQIAARLGISISTWQNWEQGRTTPDGPARALLGLIAKRPRVLIEDLVSVT
jgi:DNA-binding transcriptional regulator YiaG